MEAPFSSLGASQGGLAFCQGLSDVSPFLPSVWNFCMDSAPSPLSSLGLERWDFPLCLCPTWNKGEVGRIPSIQTSQWGAAWQAAL